jgi:DNA-binding NtrC family response regulator
MRESITAMLVENQRDSLGVLRSGLEKLSVNTFAAKNCAEAALALWSDATPHLVFTEIQLTDGNWADILTLAAKASAPVNVIVVAPFADVSFYVQVIERGAYDFVVPPLAETDLLHVVRTAAGNVLRQRRERTATLPLASLVATPKPEDVESDHAPAGVDD